MAIDILPNSCRVCLQIEAKMRSLYVTQEDDDEPPNKMLEHLTGICLEPPDIQPELPKNICKTCELSLRLAYHFRLKALKAQTVITAFFSVKVHIKNEVINYEENEVPDEEEETDFDDPLTPTPIKRQRVQWSPAAEEFFLDLWHKNVNALRTSRKNRHIYVEMSEEMRKNGFELDPLAIKNKIDNFTTKYRKYKPDEDWNYYPKVREIIGRFIIKKVESLVEDNTSEKYSSAPDDVSSSLPTAPALTPAPDPTSVLPPTPSAQPLAPSELPPAPSTSPASPPSPPSALPAKPSASIDRKSFSVNDFKFIQCYRKRKAQSFPKVYKKAQKK